MLQDYDDANEATQEVFLAAWQGLPSFRSEARFATWLYRIAYHCGGRHLERRKREQVRHSALQVEHLVVGIGNEQEAEVSVEREDLQAVVREHLSHLPMKSRLVLTLRHLEDRTYEEMAQILALPIGTIKTHLFRARNMLKERLLARHETAACSHLLSLLVEEKVGAAKSGDYVWWGVPVAPDS